MEVVPVGRKRKLEESPNRPTAGAGTTTFPSSEKKRRTNAAKKPVDKNNCTGRWTKDEHALFLEGIKLHGKEWKKIAETIPTRTVVQIRTHAQKYFQKLAKAEARVRAGYPPEPRRVPKPKKKKKPPTPRKRKMSAAARRRAAKQSAAFEASLQRQGSLSLLMPSGQDVDSSISVERWGKPAPRSDSSPTSVADLNFHFSSAGGGGRSGAAVSANLFNSRDFGAGDVGVGDVPLANWLNDVGAACPHSLRSDSERESDGGASEFEKEGTTIYACTSASLSNGAGPSGAGGAGAVGASGRWDDPWSASWDFDPSNSQLDNFATGLLAGDALI
jgi:SHAQKYF class myb-like DNA-binding protein